MTNVKLKIGIRYIGARRNIGDEIGVSDSVAKRWEACGIADIIAPPTPPAPPEPEQTGGDDISTPDTPQSEKRTSTSAKK